MKHLNLKDLTTLYYSQTARHAMKTALAAIISIVVYQYFDLPRGYWATITALIVMQSNIDTGSLEMTLKVASHRLVGTVVGAAVALAILFWIPYNHWQLLVIIFVIILAFTYINRYYEGFKLAGVTALIILLLSNHESLTHSFAFIRVTEILLGVIIAVLVTVFIWPYRITDHLQEHRIARLSKIRQLYLNLLAGKKESQYDEMSQLLLEIEADLKTLKVAKKGLRNKNRELLVLEDKLIRSTRRLGCSYARLPQAYWDFVPLQEMTQKLMQDIADAINGVITRECNQEHYAIIRQEAEQYEKSFDGFRSQRRQAGSEPLCLDDSYDVINTYNALQRCAERVCDFGGLY
jgi:uncharacterized membrane protein YgaE (UPF0421/DUF939 family)